MTFFDSIKTVFRKFAEFEGRATRPEFWWFALFSFLVSSALTALLAGPLSPNAFGVNVTNVNIAPVINLAGFWNVAVLLPSLAVAVRRLRDAGREWTELFWILLPIAGLIVLIVRLADPSIPAQQVSPPVQEAVAP